MTNNFFIIWSGLFGLVLGSFLNVVVLRDKERKSILTGRSHCTNCGYTLQWYDLIPVLSFMLLGGKCRSCRKAISIQYPLVELIAGLLTMLITWLVLQRSLPVLAGVGLLGFVLILLVVSLIDYRTLEVPVEYVVVAGFLGALAMTLSHQLNFTDSIRGLIIGAGSLLVISYTWKLLFKQEGMGEGDWWIAGAIGATVGFPLVVVALFAAVFSGAFIGIIQISVQKKSLVTQIPFGPFLFLGALVALVWGQTIINWYILNLWI